jgi:formamidopyrimidine-DNA glycosylase
MPELPEVETVCRALSPFVVGKQIGSVEFLSPKIRYPLKPVWKKYLKDEVITDVTRRAKFIVMSVKPYTILLHLGMTGVVRCVGDMTQEILQKHDHIKITFTDGSGIIFNDTRRFGQFDLVKIDELESHKSLVNLGFEPFDAELTPAVFHACITRSQRAIKLAIMDQKILVGVGNIYASESLYLAGIHPARSASSLSAVQSKKLLTAIRQVLKDAIYQGGSTLRDFRHTDGAVGYFQQQLNVYDREGEVCGQCDCPHGRRGAVEKITQGGRSTFFCSRKQK